MGAADFAPAVVRHVFFVRQAGSCFRCHMPLVWERRASVVVGGWSAHHRKPKGMGGSRDIERASAANCLILCGTGTTGCHGWVEKNRGLALERGLLIPKNATTEEYAPHNVRVMDGLGRWFLLTGDGRAVEVEGGAS